MSENENNGKKVKKLTQQGINRLLYRLIDSAGGKIMVTVKELEEVPPNANVHFQYLEKEDAFEIENRLSLPAPKLSKMRENP